MVAALEAHSEETVEEDGGEACGRRGIGLVIVMDINIAALDVKVVERTS